MARGQEHRAGHARHQPAPSPGRRRKGARSRAGSRQAQLRSRPHVRTPASAARPLVWCADARAVARWPARAVTGALAMRTRATLFVLASLALATLSLWIGPSFSGATRDFVFFELRLPRLLVGALVGATLSL